MDMKVLMTMAMTTAKAMETTRAMRIIKERTMEKATVMTGELAMGTTRETTERIKTIELEKWVLPLSTF